MMGTKNNPGTFDCYTNAAPDEPMFVLLGRDKHAPTLVWLWAVLRELDDEKPEVVAEARECCLSMMRWAKDHNRSTVGLGQAGLAAMLELIRSANFRAKDAINAETDDEAMRLFLSATEFEQSEDAKSMV
jgi:hypothetical protein